jgi:hypothetical protein
MAELKNTFTKSKMNKDLDDRIVPAGEYRDAQNVNINKSEGADVGALENVRGNSLLTNFNISNGSLDQLNIEIIGLHTDDETQRIFVFATNYTDTTPTRLGMHAGATNSTCYIAMRDLNTGSDSILANGNFLNFSKTHRVDGINVLQGFLYFTDNRNQPRKLNIKTAVENPNYYSNEETVSILKINPWKTMRFYNIDNNVVKSTMKNVTNEYLPYYLEGLCDTSSGDVTVSKNSTEITLNINVPSNWVGVGVKIQNFATPPVTLTPPGSTISGVVGSGAANKVKVNWPGSQSSFTIPQGNPATGLACPIDVGLNPDYNANWPGDSQFLKDKFIKFGYRFKFKDNEYSLISPFSPSVFIPLQDGYFISNKPETGEYNDEIEAYESTVISFMENKVDESDIYIDSPEGENWSVTVSKYGIETIEIIYKDSEDQSFKVVDTIENSTLANLNSSEFKYIYQSRNAIRTLPTSDTTRVADKAPIRAQSQEITGNRILYGNYVSKLGAIDSNDYRLSIGPKMPENSNLDDLNTLPYLSKEFQNHTVKQNRSYQVGIILQDKYGRSSDVVLSSLDESLATFGGLTFSGSTVNHTYRGLGDELFQYANTNIADDVWPGDSIKLLFSTPIPSQTSDLTYAGLYVPIGAVEIMQITGPTSDPGGAGFVVGSAVSAGDPGKRVEININSVGSGGQIVSFTVIDPGEGHGIKDVLSFTSSSSTIPCEMTVRKLLNPNPLGWYTYKVVVKQQQQDYYNAYLPGILNLGPQSVAENSGSDAYIVLHGDNINKIPRDLQEVGPTQSQFSSSEEIFGRVEGVSSTSFSTSNSQDQNKNTQYRPINLPDIVTTIGSMKDLGLTTTIGRPWFDFQTTAGGSGYNLSPFYSIEGDATDASASVIPLNENASPLIGKISTRKSIGIPGGNFGSAMSLSATNGANKLWYLYPGLSIYETNPTKSNLDIFYETPTTGTIKQLNIDINKGDVDSPRAITDFVFTLPENVAPNTVCTTDFVPLSAGGLELANANTTCQISSVLNALGVNVTNKFIIEKDAISFKYRIKTSSLPNGTFVFNSNGSFENYQFNFTITNTNLAGTVLTNNVSYGPPTNNNSLTNITPSVVGLVNSEIVLPNNRSWNPTGAPSTSGIPTNTLDSDALAAGVIVGRNGAYADDPAITPFNAKDGLYWQVSEPGAIAGEVDAIGGHYKFFWGAGGLFVDAPGGFQVNNGSGTYLPRLEMRNTSALPTSVGYPAQTETQESGSISETVYHRLQAINPWWPYIFTSSSIPPGLQNNPLLPYCPAFGGGFLPSTTDQFIANNPTIGCSIYTASQIYGNAQYANFYPTTPPPGAPPPLNNPTGAPTSLKNNAQYTTQFQIKTRLTDATYSPTGGVNITTALSLEVEQDLIVNISPFIGN